MKTIGIEWRYLRIDGVTCDRGADTGGTLRVPVDDLNRTCAARDVHITLTETAPGPGQIARSNQVLVGGRRLEALVPTVQAGRSGCRACGGLTGRAAQCRTVKVGGRSCDAPPAFLIRAGSCRPGGCC